MILAFHGDWQAALRSRKVAGPVERDGRLALVQIVGPMSRDGMFDGEPIGTSTDRARHEINQLAADPGVAGIGLLVDSGGGAVAGTKDLADSIANAARQKYVGAHVRDMGASAAYWVASQARQVFVDATTVAGGIGTYGVALDSSGLADRLGLRFHVIRAGKFKGAGTPGTEITAEQLSEMQRTVDALNEHFVAGVARGRKLPLSRVRELADGRVHVGKELVTLGLADGVLSFSNFWNQLRAAFPAESQPKGKSLMFESEKRPGPACESFWNEVESRIQRGQSRERAISAVVASEPDLHKSMLAEVNAAR